MRKHFKLATQINMIFTAVALLTSLVFLFALNRVFSDFREQQNLVQLQIYFDDVMQRGYLAESDYNGFVVYEGGIALYYSNFGSIDNLIDSETLYDYYLANWKPSDFEIQGNMFIQETFKVQVGKELYTFIVDTNRSRVVIGFTGHEYLEVATNEFTTLLQISFIALILLGNVIILTWSRLTVDRVRKLQTDVGNLVAYNYSVPIEITGRDEITGLALEIEKMRREIESSEKTKKEMLQNVSHDFKTPIAVIKSYAEAIADGVSDPKEAEVIIKQIDILNQKVRQLLEFNKLEYLKDVSEFEMISIKDVLLNIVNAQKYRSHIKFETDLDDSKYFGIYENFNIIFSNIVDNALRYAKSTIRITLKNRKLTFYNDGEPISENFVEHMFKPYEKGHKGQFGLGMSIVQKTCEHFNLSLSVKNVSDGVEFTIEPF